MIARLAYVYISFLLALDLFLISLSVGLSVSALLGSERLYSVLGKIVFFSAFGLMVPVSFLAKDRNVWKNELRVCPRWLKIAVVTLLIYGGAVTSLQVIFLGGGPDIESNSLSSFSLPFAFEAMPLAILYSLLRSRSVSEEELINRVRISTVALAVCVAFVLAAHFNYVPHLTR
jgi:hypothetical protein